MFLKTFSKIKITSITQIFYKKFTSESDKLSKHFKLHKQPIINQNTIKASVKDAEEKEINSVDQLNEEIKNLLINKELYSEDFLNSETKNILQKEKFVKNNFLSFYDEHNTIYQHILNNSAFVFATDLLKRINKIDKSLNSQEKDKSSEFLNEVNTCLYNTLSYFIKAKLIKSSDFEMLESTTDNPHLSKLAEVISIFEKIDLKTMFKYVSNFVFK